MRDAATTSAVDHRPADEVEHARRAWREGDRAQARALLARRLQTSPDDAAALHQRGVMALSDGAVDEALEHLFRAVERARTQPEYWCDLGRALHAKAQHGQAQEAYMQALNLQPDHLDSVFHLANLLRETARPQEALQFYSALMERDPVYRDGWNHTGLVLLQLGHRDDARRCFEHEIAQDAGHVQAILNLGGVLCAQGRALEALEVYDAGLKAAPRSTELMLHRAGVMNALGMAAEARDQLREAIRLEPGLAAGHHAVIDVSDRCADQDTRGQQSQRREWYRQCVPAPLTAWAHQRDPQPYRKLRVGYVAGDFASAGAAATFAPLLIEYDRRHFEVHCFFTAPQEDALTAWVRSEVAGLHSIAGMTDAAAARFIDGLRIDILVDLGGHGPGSRLGLFAHRPAPIRITGWGGSHGSGMPEMDFLAADDVHLPDTDLAHFTERRLDVPASMSYHPSGPLPAVTPLPFLARGFVTFGSFAEWSHITAPTIALWSRVLGAVPGAELFLARSPAAGEAGEQWLRARFMQAGVAGARVQFLSPQEWDGRMRCFGEIDIQLDTCPQGSARTLLDGLAMGVPTLTLAGRTPAARLSASLLHTVEDLQGWVARSEDDFVALAARRAADAQALRPLRAKLRDRLMKSPVGNTLAYTRAVEQAYRQVWKQHIANQRAA